MSKKYAIFGIFNMQLSQSYLRVTDAMNSAALGVERFRSELDLRAGEIETLLALGATQQQAVLKTVQLSAFLMYTFYKICGKGLCVTVV